MGLAAGFAQKFGSIGARLARVLHKLPLELVAIVGRYALYATASETRLPEPPQRLAEYWVGQPASEPASPHACMAISPDGPIWVATGTCVRVFREGGGELPVFVGSHGAMELLGMAFDHQGQVFIASKKLQCVLVYRDNFPARVISFVRSFGVPQGQGPFDPFGVALDSDRGLVYVTDHRSSCVRVFDRDHGVQTRRFGSLGTGFGKLCLPTHIAVHPTTRQVFVVDGGNHRIQVIQQVFGCCLNHGVAFICCFGLLFERAWSTYTGF